MAKLFVLFCLFIAVDVSLLVALGGVIGLWPTLAIVGTTAALGAWLGKREGLRVWRAWRAAMAAGQVPSEGILGGVLVLAGALLLIAPGFLSDLAGAALFLPPVRRWIADKSRQRLERSLGHTVRYRVEVGGVEMGSVGHADILRGLRATRAAKGAVIDTEGEVVEERRAGDPRGALESPDPSPP